MSEGLWKEYLDVVRASQLSPDSSMEKAAKICYALELRMASLKNGGLDRIHNTQDVWLMMDMALQGLSPDGEEV